MERRANDAESDAELRGFVVRVASGDKQALGDLYRLLAPQALAVGKRMLGDLASAEELVHDAFLEIWRRANEYQPERGSVRAWVFTIVRSRAIDRLRRRKKGAQVGEDALLTSTLATVTPLDQSMLAETKQHLRAMIADVPPEQRQLLELAYFEGLSHSDIAEKTGVPLGTVKTRIRAAMLKLMSQRDRLSEPT